MVYFYFLKYLALSCTSNENNDCSDTQITFSIYRVSFGLAIFHLILACIMIKIYNEEDKRMIIQDGWWGVKIIVLIILTIISFWIPNEFFIIYSWIAFIGSIIFIIIQIILLIDFAHNLVESWVGKMEESENEYYICYFECKERNFWMILLFGSTFLLYLAFLIGTIFLFLKFGSRDCPLNQIFISINTIISFFLTIISMHPKIKESNQYSSPLQSGIVIAYNTYLLWSAMLNQPDQNCNRYSHVQTDKFSEIVIIGVIFTMIAIVYSTVTTSLKISLNNDEESQDLILKSINKELLVEEEPEEFTSVKKISYNVLIFHIVYALGATYLAMLMSDWRLISGSESSSYSTINTGIGAMWMKVATTWLSSMIYIWTLLAPILLEDENSYFY